MPRPTNEDLQRMLEHQRKIESAELEKTSYHEAAHSVVAYYYGRSLFGVDLKKEEGRVGTSYSFFPPHPEIHELEQNIDIYLAGTASDRRCIEDIERKNSLPVGFIPINGWLGGDLIGVLEEIKEYISRTGINNCLVDQISIDENFGENIVFPIYGNHVVEILNRKHIWNCVDHIAKILFESKEISTDDINSEMSNIWESENVLELERRVNSNNHERQWGSAV